MAKYDEQKEPLHFAVQEGLIELVRELLKSGMAPDTRTIHGVTPLMVSARYGNKEVAQLLIEAGADVNAKDRRSSVWEGQQTPLHYACDSGRICVATLLLENGANPNCISQSGDTPLSIAMMGNKALADCLLKHGANPNGPEKCAMPPIVAAALRDDLAGIERLLKLGANPNRIGGNNESALGYTHSVECAAALLSGGANPNLKNANGELPLHKKLLAGSLDLIRLLIRSGADANGYSNGFTALHILAGTPRIEVTQLLIELGANVNALSEKGDTPLDTCLTQQQGNFPDNFHDERQRTIELLRKHGAKTKSGS